MTAYRENTRIERARMEANLSEYIYYKSIRIFIFNMKLLYKAKIKSSVQKNM